MSDAATTTVLALWSWPGEPTAVEATFASAVDGAPRGIAVARAEGPGELAAWLDGVAEQHPGADIALVADAGSLPPGWLARLSAAAYSDDALAAATLQALEPGVATGDGSPSLPRVLAADPHATLIRRSVFELLGGLDPGLSHPAAALAEFAARAQERGLSTALVTSAVVETRPGGAGAWPEADAARLRDVHPWISAAREDEAAREPAALTRALLAAATTRRKLSVTIDARALGTGVGGTQTYIGALLLALGARPELEVRAVTADPLTPTFERLLSDRGVSTITYEQAANGGVPRTDIVHRPQQVFTIPDLRLLELLGERIVVTHMDLIAYRTPTYHADVDTWRAYRRATRLGLAAADAVVFFSRHARDDALAEELIPPERAAIAGIGLTPPDDSPASRPAGVPEGRELLLMLGADYAHKNRPFALALVDELRVRHGWDGVLVLAGAHVPHGSSADAERAVLAARPGLAAHVVDLGRVDDAARRWLTAHAAAHLCASSYEGFGLGPLEAAAAGSPCVYAACTSLAETIDPSAATIVPWDPVASADRAAALLAPGPERERHLAILRAALARHRWEPVAETIVGVYRAALDSPFRAARPRVHSELQREQLLLDTDHALRDLRDRVASGMRLIDARDPLLDPNTQRGLMRVGTRRWLARPVLAPFAWLGRLGTGRPHGAADGDASP